MPPNEPEVETEQPALLCRVMVLVLASLTPSMISISPEPGQFGCFRQLECT